VHSYLVLRIVDDKVVRYKTVSTVSNVVSGVPQASDFGPSLLSFKYSYFNQFCNATVELFAIEYTYNTTENLSDL